MIANMRTDPEGPNFDSPEEIRENQVTPILVIGNLCQEVRASLEDNLGIKGTIFLSHSDFQKLDKKIRTNTILVKDEEKVPSRLVEQRTKTLTTLDTIESKHLGSPPDDHLVIIVSNTRDQMGFSKNKPGIKNQQTISDKTPQAVIRVMLLRKDMLLEK